MIELAELDHAAALPMVRGLEVGPGRYRLTARQDRARVRPLRRAAGVERTCTAREAVAVAVRDGDRVRFEEPPANPSRYAFLGVRPCDLRAIATQDKVLGAGVRYAERRRSVVHRRRQLHRTRAIPASASPPGGDPGAESGFDIVLTEVDRPGRRTLLRRAAGTDRGRAVLAALPQRPADAAAIAEASERVAAAADAHGPGPARRGPARDAGRPPSNPRAGTMSPRAA